MGRKTGGAWVFFPRSHQNAISPIWEKTREKMRDKKFRLRETKLPRATFTFILSFSSFLTTRFFFPFVFFCYFLFLLAVHLFFLSSSVLVFFSPISFIFPQLFWIFVLFFIFYIMKFTSIHNFSIKI